MRRGNLVYGFPFFLPEGIKEAIFLNRCANFNNDVCPPQGYNFYKRIRQNTFICFMIESKIRKRGRWFYENRMQQYGLVRHMAF